MATATIGEGGDPAVYTDLAPTVFVVRAPADPVAPSVISDDYAGVHSVIDHLVSLGHRRIAHIGGPPNISTAITRLRAYREALFERQLPLEPQLVTHVENIEADAGTAAMERLLADSGSELHGGACLQRSRRLRRLPSTPGPRTAVPRGHQHRGVHRYDGRGPRGSAVDHSRRRPPRHGSGSGAHAPRDAPGPRGADTALGASPGRAQGARINVGTPSGARAEPRRAS